MTVFLVSPTKDDVSAALQYGDLFHVNTRFVYSDEIEKSLLPDTAYAAIIEAARRFNSLKDYVLISGDHMQLAHFIAALSLTLAFRHDTGLVRSYLPKIKLLRWDKKAEGYVPVEIDLIRLWRDTALGSKLTRAPLTHPSAGAPAQARTTRYQVPDSIDVKRLREGLGMSQPEFALRFGFSIGTLRQWEQGRRYPDGPARVLLTVISHSPQVVKAALESVPERRAAVG